MSISYKSAHTVHTSCQTQQSWAIITLILFKATSHYNNILIKLTCMQLDSKWHDTTRLTVIVWLTINHQNIWLILFLHFFLQACRLHPGLHFYVKCAIHLNTCVVSGLWREKQIWKAHGVFLQWRQQHWLHGKAVFLQTQIMSLTWMKTGLWIINNSCRFPMLRSKKNMVSEG